MKTKATNPFNKNNIAIQWIKYFRHFLSTRKPNCQWTQTEQNANEKRRELNTLLDKTFPIILNRKQKIIELNTVIFLKLSWTRLHYLNYAINHTINESKVEEIESHLMKFVFL